MNWLTQRDTGDLLVVMIAGTVCAVVLGGGMAILINAIVNPGQNSPIGLALVSDAVNTLIGLLAGFVAGRAENSRNPLSPPLPGITPPRGEL